MVSPTQGQVAHALLTRPPLGIAAPFDLNVLCTPPAFILSQDQTLVSFLSSRASLHVITSNSSFPLLLSSSLALLLSCLKELSRFLFVSLFNFQGPFCYPRSRALLYLPTSLFRYLLRSSPDSLTILPHFYASCQYLFAKKIDFFAPRFFFTTFISY